MKQEIPKDNWQAIAQQLVMQHLQDGKGGLQLRVRGQSMHPALTAGETLQIKPPKQLRPGDLVVYRRHGVLVVHRLLQLHTHWAHCLGDDKQALDAPVSRHHIVGVVEAAAHHPWRQRFKQRYYRLKHGVELQRWQPYEQHQLQEYQFAGMGLQLFLPSTWRLDLEAWQAWQDDGQFDAWQLLVHATSDHPQLLKNPGAKYELQLHSQPTQTSLRGHRMVGNIFWQRRQMQLNVVADFASSVENALRVLLAYYLLRQGQGLLLHAAGVVQDGKAYLFFGHSGSGKSTLAAISQTLSLPVISDDLIAIRKIDGQWMVDGLPFKGTHPQAKSQAGQYPLAALFHLQQAPQMQRQALQPASAMGLMLASLPFISHDALAIQQALPHLQALLSDIAVERLHFLPQPEVWQTILAASDGA